MGQDAGFVGGQGSGKRGSGPFPSGSLTRCRRVLSLMSMSRSRPRAPFMLSATLWLRRSRMARSARISSSAMAFASCSGAGGSAASGTVGFWNARTT